MPKITERKDYNGVLARIERPGLAPLIAELEEVLTGFPLLVKEEKDTNVAPPFASSSTSASTTPADGRSPRPAMWIGSSVTPSTEPRSVSGSRSRCQHAAICSSWTSAIFATHSPKGVIYVGILVVPDDTLARFLTDRGPRFSDAVRHVRAARAEDFPLLLLGIHHDGPGEPLAKQFKAQAEENVRLDLVGPSHCETTMKA